MTRKKKSYLNVSHGEEEVEEETECHFKRGDNHLSQEDGTLKPKFKKP